ncbi:ribose-5-phosphate isomerase A, partial [Streptococcus danieliae]|nr:ribose-5-phosphate isomerase A [Streptococcus danieliae]
TIRKMEELGLKPVLRYKDDKVLVTDNGNFIVDLHLGYGFDIKSVENKLASVVGLVEHGLFLNTCKHCIKGTPDGPIIIENPNK